MKTKFIIFFSIIFLSFNIFAETFGAPSNIESPANEESPQSQNQEQFKEQSSQNKINSTDTELTSSEQIASNSNESSNSTLWILFISYLLLVGFLRYAKENPQLAPLVVKALYYGLGFPLLAIIYIMKNSHKWKNVSGGENSSSESRGSSGSNKVSSKKSASDQIKVQGMVYNKSGVASSGWRDGGSTYNNPNAIARKMAEVERNFSNSNSVSKVRVRAIDKNGNVVDSLN